MLHGSGPGGVLEGSGGVLGASWAVLGASWANMPFRRRLKASKLRWTAAFGRPKGPKMGASGDPKRYKIGVKNEDEKKDKF